MNMEKEKSEKEIITEMINGFLNTVDNDLGIKKYNLPVKNDFWSHPICDDVLTASEDEWDIF